MSSSRMFRQSKSADGSRSEASLNAAREPTILFGLHGFRSAFEIVSFGESL